MNPVFLKWMLWRTIDTGGIRNLGSALKAQLIPDILLLCSSGFWKFLVCISCWDFYTRRKEAQGSWSNQTALVPEACHSTGMQQHILFFLPSDIRLSNYAGEPDISGAETKRCSKHSIGKLMHLTAKKETLLRKVSTRTQ